MFERPHFDWILFPKYVWQLPLAYNHLTNVRERTRKFQENRCTHFPVKNAQNNAPSHFQSDFESPAFFFQKVYDSSKLMNVSRMYWKEEKSFKANGTIVLPWKANKITTSVKTGGNYRPTERQTEIQLSPFLAFSSPRSAWNVKICENSYHTVSIIVYIENKLNSSLCDERLHKSQTKNLLVDVLHN